MLINVFDLECIKDMSNGFFDRGSLFAFDFAAPRTIRISAALYVAWLCQKCIVTGWTLFLEPAIHSPIVTFARAEFKWQIRRRLDSYLKSFCAIFALALDSYVVRLPVKSLALSRAKVIDVFFRPAGLCFKDALALWTSALRAAKSIKARTATEVALIAPRLVFSGFKSATASGAINNSFGHKNASYQRDQMLVEGIRSPIEGSENNNRMVAAGQTCMPSTPQLYHAERVGRNG